MKRTNLLILTLCVSILLVSCTKANTVNTNTTNNIKITSSNVAKLPEGFNNQQLFTDSKKFYDICDNYLRHQTANADDTQFLNDYENKYYKDKTTFKSLTEKEQALVSDFVKGKPFAISVTTDKNKKENLVMTEGVTNKIPSVVTYFVDYAGLFQ